PPCSTSTRPTTCSKNSAAGRPSTRVTHSNSIRALDFIWIFIQYMDDTTPSAATERAVARPIRPPGAARRSGRGLPGRQIDRPQARGGGSIGGCDLGPGDQLGDERGIVALEDLTFANDARGADEKTRQHGKAAGLAHDFSLFVHQRKTAASHHQKQEWVHGA